MVNTLTIEPEIFQRLHNRATLDSCSTDDLLMRLLDSPPLPAHLSNIPYQKLLEHTTDTISLFDLDLRYCYVNPILGVLTGLNPTDMIGKTDQELGMPEQNVTFWKSNWQTVIATKQEQIVTFDFLTSKGARVYESRLTPILDDNDAIIYLLAITRDITEPQRTEEMLRDIANRLPGMILSYRLKPNGEDEVPFVSAAVTTLFEVTVEEAYANIGKIWAKVHPDDLEKFRESIGESAETLMLWDYEWRIRMNDGSTKWISGRGTPRRLEDGSTLWNTLLLDITDYKTLEHQQKELIDQLELLIKTAKLGIWRLEMTNAKLEWNDQMLEIYGITREAYTNDLESWTDLLHPDDRAYILEQLNKVSVDGQIFDVNYRIIRPDGDIRYVMGSANSIHDDKNRVISLIGVNMDVTDIRRSDAKLQQINEMLQSIIEHIPVMIALFDENGQVRFVNRYWIDQLGWTVDELNQEADPLALFYPDPDYRRQAVAYMSSAQPGWRDFEISTQRGQVLDTAWASVRLSDGSSIGIGQQITERKRAEQMALEKERLIASLKMEKEHSATVQRFIANLAHDLRTPLSIIGTSRDILSRYFERIDADQRRERLETITKQLHYVTELLNDLTLINYPALDSRSLQLSPTNLVIICQVMIQDIQESVGVGHRLIFNTDQLVDFALVDDVLINRILLNLLTNAVKYSPLKSEIILRLSKRDDQLVLQVSDHGIGIADEDLAHIFDPHYRINSLPEVDGTGLGLSIVKDCVERHNGQILVESSVGHGTTFTIELPLILSPVQKEWS